MMTTLQDAANRVKIEAHVNYDMSSNNRGARLMIVRDGTIIAIAADDIAEKDNGGYISVQTFDFPGTVGPHTYEIRAGVESSGSYTMYINRLDGDATPYGARAPAYRAASFCQITEFTA